MALTSLPAETERDRQTDTETENANERVYSVHVTYFQGYYMKKYTIETEKAGDH